ncbi:MAG: class I SAM-dependent methyltransferase [Oscillospiraceae bacterium]|jgi:23S rRNA (cytosine1962-C5)-methyltransferase|nr:class I SAM-dependent methyltransferase [Oscillospiraceae bacterium]
MLLADQWQDYEVLDTGDGEKLERWGDVLLRRPDPQTIWPVQRPDLWARADAWYHRSERGGGAWQFFRPLPQRWVLRYGELAFYVRPTGFKHTGLFPEQAANWDWMRGLIAHRIAADPQAPPPRVLNLFAYTGAATLACARAGAWVCHLDAAKGMTQWAKENRALCDLPEAGIRWIIDDALKFVRREVARGSLYDGILMDPPSYGRGPGGEVWKLENELYGLVSACAGTLCEKPLFFLINSYTTGLAPSVLRNMIELTVTPRFGGHADAQEVGLPVTAGGVLPCGASGRWQAHA